MTFEKFEKLVASLSDKTEYVIPKKLSMLKYENQIFQKRFISNGNEKRVRYLTIGLPIENFQY